VVSSLQVFQPDYCASKVSVLKTLFDSTCGKYFQLSKIQETVFITLHLTGDMYSRGSAPGPAASAPAGPSAPGGSAAGQQKSGSEYGGGYSSYSGYQVSNAESISVFS